jgi:hypothetical protein
MVDAIYVENICFFFKFIVEEWKNCGFFKNYCINKDLCYHMSV